MSRRFHITADHVSAAYRVDRIITVDKFDREFRVMNGRSERPELPARWHATASGFGCGGTCDTPEDAIRDLLYDNGCNNILIVEIVEPKPVKAKRETEWFSACEINTGRHLGYIEAVSELAAKRKANKLYPMSVPYIGIRCGVSLEEVFPNLPKNISDEDMREFNRKRDAETEAYHSSMPAPAAERPSLDTDMTDADLPVLRDPCGNEVKPNDPDYREALAEYRRVFPEVHRMWKQVSDDPAIDHPDMLPHPMSEQEVIRQTAQNNLQLAVAKAGHAAQCDAAWFNMMTSGNKVEPIEGEVWHTESFNWSDILWSDVFSCSDHYPNETLTECSYQFEEYTYWLGARRVALMGKPFSAGLNLSSR